MSHSLLRTPLVAMTAIAAMISLAGCSGGSATAPDAIGNFKTIAVGDSASYKANLWPVGTDHTGHPKITSTDQYLSRFKDSENGYIQNSPATKDAKIADVTFYHDPSGDEIGVFSITGSASSLKNVIDNVPFMNGGKYINSSRSIIVGRDGNGDADAMMVAHLKDSVIVASAIPGKGGLSDSQKAAAASFIKAYVSVLTKSGNLA